MTVALLAVLIGLYALANIGERNPTARIIAFIAGAVIASLAGILGLLSVLTALSPQVEDLLGIVRPLKASQIRTLETVGAALMLGGLLGILYLWPPLQRGVARVIPLRPGSPVTYLTVVLGLLLIAQQLVAQVQAAQPLTWLDLLAQDIPLLALAFVGVGIFVRRSPAETIDRLGLRPPRQARWWLVAVLAIGVFLAVAFGIEAVANVVAPSSQKQVTDVTTVLFSRFNNPVAIILLGVLAGVVEETLFRGALQPRFGVVITAILFASLHSQYALSFATLEVFILGLGLGWLRMGGGTLPCMVTHAGYDIAVGFLSLLR